MFLKDMEISDILQETILQKLPAVRKILQKSMQQG